jgi:plasmid stabilization system protein ParE
VSEITDFRHIFNTLLREKGEAQAIREVRGLGATMPQLNVCVRSNKPPEGLLQTHKTIQEALTME